MAEIDLNSSDSPKEEEKTEETKQNTPVAESNADKQSVDEKAPANDKLTVMIVEEKSELRAFYMSALTKTEKYEVINSATPREALELLEDDYKKINIIIFNWDMPEIPGYIFCQKIRSDHRFNHIDMLVCSSDLDAEDKFLMIEMDIHHVMPKISNAGEYVAYVDEVRASYKKGHSIVTKLKNLQSLLNDIKVEQCEELFRQPEIENEINNNPKYIHLGGEARILKKKYIEAVEFLKDFLTRNANNAGAENLKSLTTLGKALCLAGKFEDAITIFDRLEAKSPRNLSHKIMAGDALLGLDNVEGAQEKFSEVLNQDAGNKNALVGMAKASAATGDFEEAKNFFSKIDGNFESRALASFFNNRGVALVRKGDIPGAIAFYENALQFLEKFKGHVYFNLGMAYYRMGNITSAVYSFQAALNSKDAAHLADKTILKELQKKGVDAFVAEFNQRKKSS